MKSRILCVFLMMCAPAYADSFSTARAVLDWENLAYTTTGTLQIDHFSFFFGFSDSTARSLVGTVTDHKTTTDNPGTAWLTTAASSSTALPSGLATASATTDFGLFESSASVTPGDLDLYSAFASSQTALTVAVVGTGTGTLQIMAPYTMSVDCTPDSPITATRVDLSAGTLMTDSITCSGAPMTKSGMLVASRDISNPTGRGSFVLRGAAVAFAQTQQNPVPEPASTVMLSIGAVVLWSVRKFNRSDPKSSQ